jgi:L,D-peptidoglycan transpeptidase YkuD (ErfK/YbiS/YcfS/YnhG family)
MRSYFAPLLLAAWCVTGLATAAATGHAVAWSTSRQLVLVTTPGWNADHGVLRRFERDGHRWRQVGAAVPVTVGTAGAAWGVGLSAPDPGGAHRADPIKHEGDNRSPAGVFRIGEAFGYAASAATAMPYRALRASDYCVDVSGSPQYNRIVDANVVGTDAVKGSTEPMRRDLHANGDQRYRLGFVIEHNPQGKPQVGSCIFAHLWHSPSSATAGCTAMTPAVMQSLLAWLKPNDRPVFVLLPQSAYERLRGDWQLPTIAMPGAAR